MNETNAEAGDMSGGRVVLNSANSFSFTYSQLDDCCG